MKHLNTLSVVLLSTLLPNISLAEEDASGLTQEDASEITQGDASGLTQTEEEVVPAPMADTPPAEEAAPQAAPPAVAEVTAILPTEPTKKVTPPVKGTYTLNGSVSTAAYERSKWVGMVMGLGIPSATYLGISIRPGVQWLHIDVKANYLMALGYSASLTLDPINFGVAPTLTGELGRIGSITIPNEQATVGYDYAQVLGGLEFGSRRSFRFFIRAGMAWVNVKARNVGSLIDEPGVTVGDPTIRVKFAPSSELGFNLFF